MPLLLCFPSTCTRQQRRLQLAMPDHTQLTKQLTKQLTAIPPHRTQHKTDGPNGHVCSRLSSHGLFESMSSDVLAPSRDSHHTSPLKVNEQREFVDNMQRGPRRRERFVHLICCQFSSRKPSETFKAFNIMRE